MLSLYHSFGLAWNHNGSTIDLLYNLSSMLNPAMTNCHARPSVTSITCKIYCNITPVRIRCSCRHVDLDKQCCNRAPITANGKHSLWKHFHHIIFHIISFMVMVVNIEFSVRVVKCLLCLDMLLASHHPSGTFVFCDFEAIPPL